MAYTKTTWNTGDVITATKLNNLETQHEKALLIDNDVALQSLDGVGTPRDMLRMFGSELIIGSVAATQDTLLQATRHIKINSGALTMLKVFQTSGDIQALVGKIQVVHNSPVMSLDRAGGAGQYGIMQALDGATVHADWGMDYTGDYFVIREDGATVRLQLALPSGFLISEHQPTCQLTHTVDQSINTASDTVLTWDTEVMDNNALHGANPTRITTALGGRYIFRANIMWETVGGASAGIFRVRFRHNDGATYFGAVGGTMAAGGGYMMTAMAMFRMLTTEYVEVYVYQASGVAVKVLAAGSVFECYRLGSIN